MNSFIDISNLSAQSLKDIIFLEPFNEKILTGKNIGLIFEKYSTRTRVSFSVGISDLGGNAVDLKFEELNISREESFEDTFLALSCYLDGIVYRTSSHKNLIQCKKYFSKPVINALSEKSHPCQVLSDLFTINEHFGSLNINILWLGDMNNVCFSLVEAVNLIDDITLTICTPKEISSKKTWKLNSNIEVIDKLELVDLKSINCVMTDVFLSMNDEGSQQKVSLLKPFIVDSELMSKTSDNSVFMHCLPAKVGFEVTEEVFRSNKSIVWHQAYNRLVAQKKLLHYIYK